jgi:8-oxo-dGTP pyrophosphatase MutT (NUDIX family)
MAEIFKVAQKAFIVDEARENVLLVRYQKSKFLPEKLNDKLTFPGGKIEFGENIDSSIVREVKEETGLIVIPSLPFYSWAWNYKKAEDDIYIYGVVRLCFLQSGKLNLTGVPQNETELSAPVWYEINSLKEENFVFDEWPAVLSYKKFRLSNPF